MSNVKIINNNNPLINLSQEKICLGALFKYGIKLWAEVGNTLTDQCFNDADNLHKVIFATLKKHLDKNEVFDKVVVSEEINRLKINTGELDVYEYCDIISNTQVTLEGAKEITKEVIKLKICRDLVTQSDEIKSFVFKNKDKSLSEIIDGIDKLNSSKISEIYCNNIDFIDIFLNLKSDINNIADNPPDTSKFMMGPFKSINDIYGSLSRPGNITVVAARSGTNKTSLGMFVNSHISGNNNIPVLHLDNGEMSAEELKYRAICMFSEGRIPYWAIERGEWRKNSEWARIMDEIWPRVSKVKFFYQNIGGFSVKDILSYIRRFYYNKVGRGNMFLVHFDYLKPFEITKVETPEWKEMGHFIQDVKSFITNEIHIPFWTSLQLNRLGITNNKNSSQVDDSENSFSISDRIQHQASHAFILRYKTFDEIMQHGKEFGNMKAIFVKQRHLGEKFERALDMVRVGKKQYEKNYINIEGRSFFFRDKGDLNDLVLSLKDKHSTETEDNSEIQL